MLICILPLALFHEDKPYKNKRCIVLLLVVSILFLLNILTLGFHFTNIGVDNRYPADVDLISSQLTNIGPIHLPNFDLLATAWNFTPLFLIYCAFIVGALVVLFKNISLKESIWSLTAKIIIILLPLAHQFGLIFFLLMLICLASKKSLKFVKDDPIPWVSYLCAVFFYWIISGMLLRDLWLPEADQITVVKKLANNLFRYPLVYDSLIIPFMQVVPVWFIIGSVVFIISVIRVNYSESSTRRFLLICSFACVLLLGLIHTRYQTTRYAFFFFPVIATICYLEIIDLVTFLTGFYKMKLRKALTFVLTCSPLLVFAFTEDFNLDHLLNVAAPDSNFRMGKYKIFEDHWYARIDYESPAKFINSAYSEGDKVIIDDVTISRYLDKPYINYIPIRTPRFLHQSRKQGEEELWTGKPLIYKPGKILELVPESPNCLWLIGTKENVEGVPYVKKSEAYDLAKYRVKLVSEGRDGRKGVWQLRRNP